MAGDPPHPVQAWRRRCARTPGIGQALLGLVLALGEYMDAAGRCAVSNARLAEDCEVSARTVQRQLHELRAAGLLGIDQARGGRSVNRYQARPWDDSGVMPGAVRGDTRVTAGVTPMSWEGRHQRREGVTPVSPEVEGQKDLARPSADALARAREDPPPGWVPEDDPAIAEEFAKRQAVAANSQVRGEGYGDPTNAQAARDAAAKARRQILGGGEP